MLDIWKIFKHSTWCENSFVQETGAEPDGQRREGAVGVSWVTSSVAHGGQFQGPVGACGWFSFSRWSKVRDRANPTSGISDNLGTK